MSAKDLAIQIHARHWHRMEADAKGRAPLEACGLVAGRERTSYAVYPVENELHSRTRYRMNPHEQLRIFQQIESAGLDLLAIYHSHPSGPPIPSPTDLAEAAYPDVVHLIWSPAGSSWGCRGFLIAEEQAIEVPIQIISLLAADRPSGFR